jgi:hypothetical protein
VTLIATDETGINEAVGSFYEAVAGIDPLTRWDWPISDSLSAAKATPGLHASAKVEWTALTPDRVLAMKEEGGTIMVLTHDGTMSFLSGKGTLEARKVTQPEKIDDNLKRLSSPADEKATAEAKKQDRPDRLRKLWSADQGRLAVAYWGGTLRIVDDKSDLLCEQQMPQDVTAMTWARGSLIVGLADGRVLSLALPK